MQQLRLFFAMALLPEAITAYVLLIMGGIVTRNM